MVLVEILAQINCPLPKCQPCNQFGLFTREVTPSGMCISTARDPATKHFQNSLFVSCVVPCIQKSQITSVICAEIHISGAQNDGFLSHPLQRYFRLSGVPLKLCRFILGCAIIFFICSVILGKLESFRNY